MILASEWGETDTCCMSEMNQRQTYPPHPPSGSSQSWWAWGGGAVLSLSCL